MSMRCVTDEDGNRVEVIMPVEEYELLTEALEDLDDARLYDGARAEIEREGGDPIPHEQAMREIGKVNRRRWLGSRARRKPRRRPPRSPRV